VSDHVLVVEGLKKYFPTSRRGLYVRAVDGVDLAVRRGEVIGLVGESGSGKSTVAYTVMGLYEPTEGKVLFKGQDISMPVQRRPLALKKEIQMVFQDPGTSLNPQRTVAQTLALPLRVHRKLQGKGLFVRIGELLNMVELPVDYMFKYPRMLGGGERQAVAIARAIATEPSLIVLDEPTSALDVSVQAKIVSLLMRLRSEFGLSYLFITHDLSLMRNVASRVVVMYLGKVVETAPTLELFTRPLHPYTQMLMSSIPVVSKEEEDLKPKKVLSQGEIPSPVHVPPGCSFVSRCPVAEKVCGEQLPALVPMPGERVVRCHQYEKIGCLKWDWLRSGCRSSGGIWQ